MIEQERSYKAIAYEMSLLTIIITNQRLCKNKTRSKLSKGRRGGGYWS